MLIHHWTPQFSQSKKTHLCLSKASGSVWPELPQKAVIMMGCTVNESSCFGAIYLTIQHHGINFYYNHKPHYSPPAELTNNIGPWLTGTQTKDKWTCDAVCAYAINKLHESLPVNWKTMLFDYLLINYLDNQLENNLIISSLSCDQKLTYHMKQKLQYEPVI